MSIKKIREFFSVQFEDSYDTFEDEMRSECRRFFYLVFVTVFVWLPYIPSDMRIHGFPALVVSQRIGLSVLSLMVILASLIGYFKNRPDILLKAIIVYLFFGSSLITVTAGDSTGSYVGGYALVMAITLVGPFSLKFKITNAMLSLVFFLLLGIILEIDLHNPNIQYGIINLIISTVFFVIFSIIENNSKYNAWKRKKHLNQAMYLNEKNLHVIYNYANRAEASDRAKSEFLATMSHEIRTPMNAIIGIAQIQIQKDDLPQEYATAFERIYNSGNNLLGIINDILDISKIESGNLELHPVSYDLASFINDSVQLNVLRIGEKPVKLVLDIDKTLPLRLYGDELRLKQILNNILSNAIKYTEKGTVKLSVTHTMTGKNTILCITVEDTGQGIKPEDKNKLFVEYSRLNIENNRMTEGTGLGLKITKLLVGIMEGTIDVESVYGKGSIFTVMIRQQISGDYIALGDELAGSLNSFTYSGRKHASKLQITREPMPYGSVLVVDDMETNLYVTKGLLLPYKLNVETVLSGYAAIGKVADGNRYDIIFMDHMMPIMDGIETTKKLREIGFLGAIVALTANAIVGNDEIFIQNGFDAFISKPIDVRQLDTVLKNFVRDKLNGKGQIGRQVIRETDIDSGYEDMGSTAKKNERAESETSKLMKDFCHDGKVAVDTIRDATATGNIRLFTDSIRNIKTMLADIGEEENVALAGTLEKAGEGGDWVFILEHWLYFVKKIEAIVDRFEPGEEEELSEIDDNTVSNIHPEKINLSEHFLAIETACNNYDDTASYAAIKKLKELNPGEKVLQLLDDCHNLLFTDSDFEGVAQKCRKFLDASGED